MVNEIKKLWPGTLLVTGKPRHSESNGGIERRNRTVEEKIKNWMHENMRITPNIGHSLFHSSSGDVIPRFTGVLVVGRLTI